MSDCPPGKSSWPEAVGRNGEEAAKAIEKENRRVDAIVLKDGTPVTRDFRCDRVWVWVDDHGIVLRTPTVGKSSWPEVVGRKGEDAAALIEKENSSVDAIVLKDGTPVTLEYRCDRVWVWVNDAGNVVRTPIIG